MDTRKDKRCELDVSRAEMQDTKKSGCGEFWVPIALATLLIYLGAYKRSDIDFVVTYYVLRSSPLELTEITSKPIKSEAQPINYVVEWIQAILSLLFNRQTSNQYLCTASSQNMWY